MRVLLTGGGGYLGSCVVEQLIARSHEVRVLDNFLWGRESLEKVEKKIEIIDADIRDLRVLCKALHDIDAVVHLAGIVGEAACRDNPIAHYTTNIAAVEALVNCMNCLSATFRLEFSARCDKMLPSNREGIACCRPIFRPTCQASRRGSAQTSSVVTIFSRRSGRKFSVARIAPMSTPIVTRSV